MKLRMTFGVILTALLVFMLAMIPQGNPYFIPIIPVYAEAAESSAAPEHISSLIQTDGIQIPFFRDEDMKTFEIPDNEALQFTRTLRVGWNLGNTFDAQDPGDAVQGRDYETYWCGAKTSRKLIQELKAAGFKLIRMPVSWHNHLTDDDYTIDETWMNRVREVAGWIVDEGMYVIINIHHDNSKKYLYPDREHYDQSEKYVTAIWAQLADAFSDFDDHCIFESMNEPRLVGTDYEWWLNEAVPQCREAAECINELNQKFVDTVRSTGGNNATRYLSVPGYCASPDGALSLLFQVPEDSAENRIIIEVHAYTPYNFALNLQSTDSSFDLEKNAEKKQEISVFMNKLYNKFIKYGRPVLIDEFGALQKNQNDLQDRVNFAAYYIASASARGITCCWWDNHVFSGSGERFGLIDRNAVRWKHPDIALALLRNCLYHRESESIR